MNQDLREKVLREYEEKLDTEIFGFFKEHRFLSNFHIAPISYRELIFPTTEHAYMAMKVDDDEFWLEMSQVSTPREARNKGQLCPLRPDWEQVKTKFMYEVCFNKFTQHNDLRKKLLATDNKPLTENNWWDCTVWGVCNGVGENHLGKILMRIRDEIV